jgi:phenylalanyl-tRNA synthetase beta chain
MNILVPDTWLREYLKTDATPKQIKECLSFCGPSVERINSVNGETVYDIEITVNRVDSMSIYGVAREASVILPEFGISATLLPLQNDILIKKGAKPLDITVTDKDGLCNRILAIAIKDVAIAPSPAWMQKRLVQIGLRPLNNVIDITNYVMWETGHPVHVFDYDRLKEKNILVRYAKKGETLVTLDHKTHTLGGGEIIFDNGKGEIIDLPSIMGTANTATTDTTKNILLFIENSHAEKIRYASMGLAIRTQAAVLAEKSPDPELAEVAIKRAAALYEKIAHGKLASTLLDIYPHPVRPQTVIVSQSLIDKYLGLPINPKRIIRILKSLGCTVTYDSSQYSVTPPTARAHDIVIPEDVVEEISRIYGYHAITGVLPQGEPPMTFEESILGWEIKLKQKLCDWGYTETYTYSMISEELMNLFSLSKNTAYKIANPLSNDWVYMRPTLLPSMLLSIKENMQLEGDLKLFELSMTYAYQKDNLPLEQSTLIVAVSGSRYGKLKGIAEALFSLFGIELSPEVKPATSYYQPHRSLRLGNYGQIGEIKPSLLDALEIHKPVTVLELSIDQLVKHAKATKKFIPIAKNPASYEDLAFVVPQKTYVAPVIRLLKTIDPLIKNVTLFDSYNAIRTFHITYQSDTKNLTSEDISKIREKIIKHMKKEFNATLKTI